MKSWLRANPIASVILLLFVLLASTYSLITPAFETPDERHHFPVAEYISRTWKLPVAALGDGERWEQQALQSPLYYLISAALIAPIDTSDLDAVYQLNPHAKLGLVPEPDNKMVMLDTSADRFPWQGSILALRTIRFFSVALGTATVLLVYLLGKQLSPESRWIPLLMMALVAFNPQFLFISGAMNNDNMVNMWGALMAWLLARTLREGLTLRRSIEIAVALALASITKTSGVTIIPLVGLVYLYDLWRSRDWKLFVQAGLILAGFWLLIAAWWYLRNIQLYGSLTVLELTAEIVGCTRDLTLWDLHHEWWGFYVSYWALFGHVNIIADWPVYQFIGLFLLLGAVGFVAFIVQQVRRAAWKELLVPVMLLIHLGLVMYGLISWTLICWASQGRLSFSSIGAVAGVTAFGLLHWLPEKQRPWLAGVVALPLLAIAVVSPFRYIAPVYQEPPIVAAVPADAVPVNTVFGGLEIVAVQVDRSAIYEAGDRVPLTLYLRTEDTLEERLSLSMTLFGRDLEEIGKLDSYPGGGNLLTTEMLPGVIYQDHYSIRLAGDISDAGALRVQVAAGQYDAASKVFSMFSPTLPGGGTANPVLIDAGGVYPAGTLFCDAPDRFDPSLTLAFAEVGAAQIALPDGPFEPGETYNLEVTWLQSGQSSRDWTMLLHLVDQAGTLRTQWDRPPFGAAFPTRLWRRPCRMTETLSVTLPADLQPGAYQLLFGLYDAADPAYTRLGVSDATGAPCPSNACPILTFEVR